MDIVMDNDKDTNAQRQKVWLKEEGKTAVVRRVETHPNYGKQYLVTVYSSTWGPETYWVKEANVEQIGHGRWQSGNGRG
jgi:hypothetical protein